jgi:hypothetical protein
MLQTIEAIYDPKTGLAFSEAVEITESIKVLVTILSPCQAVALPPERGSAQALIAALQAHPLSEGEGFSDEQIEAQVLEARENWE